jgi:hypothetical protein
LGNGTRGRLAEKSFVALEIERFLRRASQNYGMTKWVWVALGGYRDCDEAIRIDKKCTVLYTTDGISLITIPDCFNFILYFIREENYPNDGLIFGVKKKC